MNRIMIVSLASLLGLVLVSSQAFVQTAEELFQKGKHLEDVKGELGKAIEVYQTVLGKFSANKPIAAKALLHIGMCYEKLGKNEAEKAYQRLIREFADQRDVVAEARARLAALTQPPSAANASAMVVRRVWETAIDITGAPSPDGRYLSFVDWETGDLAVRDVSTGENRRLTNKGTWAESVEQALFSIVSPDGKQVAYAWLNRDLFYDLRIIGLDGSEPRVLYRNEEVGYLQPADWSPDGKYILALFSKKDRTHEIVLVSVVDGSVRVLKTLDWRYPLKMSLSPDGRYIVYGFAPQEDSPDRDIFLLATDGSREIPLVEHPANDLYPVWAPDGKRVLFSSDRTGALGAWVIQVADGKPQGSPELVKPDMGQSLPMGFTRKGSFYYGLWTRFEDIYVATLDLTSGKVVAPPTPATQRFVGFNSSPDWSPDGQYLAYISLRGPSPFASGPGSRIISIRSLKTGGEREISPELNSFSGLRWSPDGRSFLVTGYDKKSRQGLYLIDGQTGDISTIMQSEPGTYIQAANWSPDGNAIFYNHLDRTTKLQRILVREFASGKEKELYRAPLPSFYVTYGAVSPDGRQLAFVLLDQATRSTVLKVMPTAGGETRELLRLDGPESFAWKGSLSWTPDGREILFGTTRGDVSVPERTTKLWRISAEGGEPQRLELEIEGVTGPRLHPDGRRIAFAAGMYNAEVWVMENFLPKEEKAEN